MYLLIWFNLISRSGLYKFRIKKMFLSIYIYLTIWMSHVPRYFVLLFNETSFSDHNEQIRLKLPNAASYLKRLMRLKNGGKLESEREMIDGASEVSEITESMLTHVMLEVSSGKLLLYLVVNLSIFHKRIYLLWTTKAFVSLLRKAFNL